MTNQQRIEELEEELEEANKIIDTHEQEVLQLIELFEQIVAEYRRG